MKAFKTEKIAETRMRISDVTLAIAQLKSIIKGGHLHDADSLELQKWLKRYKSDAEQYDVHLTEMRQARG